MCDRREHEERIVSLIGCMVLCASLFTGCGQQQNPTDTVILGSYEQDNDLLNGPEPIEWEVIGTWDGYTILLSKYALLI